MNYKSDVTEPLMAVIDTTVAWVVSETGERTGIVEPF